MSERKGDVNARFGYAKDTTGGKGGSTVTARTVSELKSYCNSSSKLIIKLLPYTDYDVKGNIYVKSDKTIIGDVGSSLLHSQMRIENAENIVVYHVRFRDPWGDGITVKGSTKVHISWCTFDSAGEKSTKHGGKCDGAVDVVGARSNGSLVTVAHCRFLRWHKIHLFGWYPAEFDNRIKVTLYRNWYDGCGRRMPQCNQAYVHARNCLIEWKDQCSASYAKARVWVDRCYIISEKKRKYCGEYVSSSDKPKGYIGFSSCLYKDCRHRDRGKTTAKEAKAHWDTMPRYPKDWDYISRIKKEAGMQFK